MEYKARYKCRLCGEVFRNTVCTEKKTAQECIVAVCLGIVHTDPLAPQLYETHDCKGTHAGSLGLAEFQGWEAVHVGTHDRTESGLLEE